MDVTIRDYVDMRFCERDKAQKAEGTVIAESVTAAATTLNTRLEGFEKRVEKLEGTAIWLLVLLLLSVIGSLADVMLTHVLK